MVPVNQRQFEAAMRILEQDQRAILPSPRQAARLRWLERLAYLTLIIFIVSVFAIDWSTVCPADFIAL